METGLIKRGSPAFRVRFMDIRIAEQARESFDAYRSLEYGKFGGANNAKAMEISKRLRQLSWTLKKVISLLQHNANQNKHMLSGEVDPNSQQAIADRLETGDQIEIHTESFYWIAHRTGAVIRLMPGLRTFKAVGVRSVRNWLLEHVEGPGGSTNIGIGWGSSVGLDGVIIGGNGPTIATLIAGKDQGLYPNATEFFEKVERVTRQCILSPELIRET
jgi:hypothetical protein